jgi:hypothetical protein
MITLPAGVDFADLQLEITADGGLRYLPAPLGEFAVRNWAAATIADWYAVHRELGGEPDPAAETALTNALAFCHSNGTT